MVSKRLFRTLSLSFFSSIDKKKKRQLSLLFGSRGETMVTRAITNATVSGLLLLCINSALFSQPRVFVSGSGNDANPCSVTSPCRTFARAVAAVLVDGEIVALDSAGYGPVTISKSLSIVAPDGIYAGITSTGNGVTVIGDDTVAYLRGLAINATGPGTFSGILHAGASQLLVERCRISGFNTGFNAGSTGKLTVRDTITDRCSYGLFADDYVGVITIQKGAFERGGGMECSHTAAI